MTGVAFAVAGNLILAVSLAALYGWPLVATVLAARGSDAGAAGGYLAGAGGVGRPLALAGETARVVLATEALALPAGLALAFWLFRTDAWGRRFVLGLLGVSAFVPLPLHASAWLGAFGNAGRSQALGGAPLLAGWTGAAFVQAAAALPWVVLIAGVGLRTVEPELEDAARLDLPAWRVVLQVSLRRAIGATAAAALAVAVLAAGDMTVTDLLQVRTYAEEAYVQYGLGNGPGAAAAVTLPPLIVLGLLVGLAVRGLLAADPARLASAARRARPWRLGVWRVAAGLGLTVLVTATAALPIATLVWRAGRVGGDAARRVAPRWSVGGLAGSLRLAWDDSYEPLGQSLTLAAAAATAVAALAWGLAWSVRRPGPWRWVAASVVALGLAAPGPVAGMALAFAYRGLPTVYDSAAMVVLAMAVRTLPYALLVVWPAVRSLPSAFLDAAAVDGLGGAGRVWRVALPLTRGATASAWGVAFVLSLGELPATNVTTPPGLTPLSVRVWALLHTGVESHLAAVVLVTLGVVAASGLLAALGVARLTPRRDGGDGRQIG